jgi:hypothetical protein
MLLLDCQTFQRHEYEDSSHIDTQVIILLRYSDYIRFLSNFVCSGPSWIVEQ